MAMGATALAAISYVLFLIRPGHQGDLPFYIMLLTAEMILVVHALIQWWTCISDDVDERTTFHVWTARQALLDGVDVPSIDVIITVYGEPLEIVERTARAARDMRVRHLTWLCDDGNSDEVQALAEHLGVGYFRRANRIGVKAGNANHGLARTSGEFVAIFDADHVPHPDFLLVMVPHLADERVAFVQSPQAYRNVTGNFVEAGSAQSQQIFYELICPGKNRFNSAFHVGTNAVFRRAALEDIGGFYEDTHSEDIWTSIRLHKLGWRSIYLPHVLAKGLAPDSVYAHVRQQFRWASGSFEILLRANPLTTAGLKPMQRIQYMSPPVHYLVSFSNLWFLVLPPLFLLYGITPLGVDSYSWLAQFLPFYLLTQAVLWLHTGGFRPKPVVLSVATAPTHIEAFFAVLFRRRPVWRSTNERSALPSVTSFMMPQIALLLLNATAIVVAFLAATPALSTVIAVGLCVLHVGILGGVLLLAIAQQRRADRVSNAPQVARVQVGASS